jgi:predicted nucleotide-binding protein (sugar kinase/HSP70/actin superfamily)
MDKIEQYVRQNIGFEVAEGELEKIEKKFLASVAKARNIFNVGTIYRKYLKQLKAVPLNKPKNPMKIGVVGELYVLMEPFSNYFIEKELAKFGIEVTRYLNVSYMLFSPQHKIKNLLAEAEGYVTYEIGADGTESVAKCVHFAKNGYDGIIHLKPFGCTPEVNSIPIVQKVSEDFGIPVLYFSFDSQTSETGVKTRLEAFYDMIGMKRGA